MIKSFLAYTAIIEGLTGLALILVPALVGILLFKTELNSPLGTILAMVGGAAILSLALQAWLVRLQADTSITLKILLIYNAAVSFILLYGVFKLGFGGIVLWLVILFHIVQTGVCFRIIRKTRSINSS
jgi:hypothetical protein